MKRLIIHIGTHKTGTSSIQNFLYKNREALLESGVYYPPIYPANHGYTFYPLFLNAPYEFIHFIKYFNLSTEAASLERIQMLRKYWQEEFEAFQYNQLQTFIISSEDLEYLPFKGNLQNLYDFVSPYFSEIKIVIYIREFYSFINSFLQQRIRIGKATIDDVDDLVLESFKIGETVTEYAKIFGKENILVRPFVKSLLKKNDVVSDFVDVVDVKLKNIIKMERIEENSSLGMYSALLLSQLNQGFRKSDKNFAYEYADIGKMLEVLENEPQPRFEASITLSDDQLKRINAQYTTINRFLKGKYTFGTIQRIEEDPKRETIEMIPKEYLLSTLLEAQKKIRELSQRIEYLECTYEKNHNTE